MCFSCAFRNANRSMRSVSFVVMELSIKCVIVVHFDS